MSQHVEWMTADLGIGLAEPGEGYGDGVVSDGCLGLVLSADDLVVIEGTREQLQRLWVRIGQALVSEPPAADMATVQTPAEVVAEACRTV